MNEGVAMEANVAVDWVSPLMGAWLPKGRGYGRGMATDWSSYIERGVAMERGVASEGGEAVDWVLLWRGVAMEGA